MTQSDDNRVVVITGASRGLGRDIALRFGRAGCRVVVNFMTSEQAGAAVTKEICRFGGDAILFRADVGSSTEVEEMISTVARQWGRIDVVVNNAGITKDGLLLRMDEEDWDRILNTNLKGAFNLVRAASKIMSKQREGHIINISSIVGLRGREGQANYAASKAGLIGLTKVCAKEFGPFNIKVNAVLPGYIPTDMGGGISDDVRTRILHENALNRVSEPTEVADFIYHLSTMKNVSGQVFNLDSRIL